MKIIEKFKHYFTNLLLIWGAILFYNLSGYYSNYIREEAQITMLYLALAYTLIGLIICALRSTEKISESKGTLFFKVLKKTLKWVYYNIKFVKKTISFPKIKRYEKTAVLFIVIKLLFLPLMTSFFFQNLHSLLTQVGNITSLQEIFTLASFNLILFPFLITTIFMLDTLWFSFGYTFESKSLKNTIKSVEPTFFGWIVVLICYPPLNGWIGGKYIPWYANEFVNFSGETTTFIMKMIILLALLVYLGATFALGTRCSNLTNRGIVTRGPYSIVRHPAYFSKNLAWWITIIPVFSLLAVVSMGTWTLIYHLRSITEERHLMSDPDYVAYCKKVRYRYIPGIY